MPLERSDIVRDAAGFETPDIHSSSRDYARRFSGKTGNWFIKVQENATKALIADLSPRSALDVGGGHGQNLNILRQKNIRTTILASSLQCTQLIQHSLLGNEIKLEVAPLTSIPLREASFDLVLSYRMLTHLSDWQSHIKELCRMSRKTVLVEYPVKKGFNALSDMFFKAKKNVEGNTRPYTLFHEKEIASIFENQGFRLVGRLAQFFWPMAFHRLHNSVFLAKFLEITPRKIGLTSFLGSPVIARFDRRGN